jgi:hypothetical protein
MPDGYRKRLCRRWRPAAGQRNGLERADIAYASHCYADRNRFGNANATASNDRT